jgi:hypothetical protein
MTDESTNYCICDSDNGWVSDGAGGCDPACIIGGRDDDGVVTNQDECWPTADTPYTGTHVEIAGVGFTYDATRGSGCEQTSDYRDADGNAIAGSGFCTCNQDDGWDVLYDDVYTATAIATTPENPCIPKCYKFGQDGDDECWGTLETAAYYTDATLAAEVPGCILSDTTGFCMCDEDNGWFAPLDGNGAVDTDFDGACIPMCY